MGNYVCIRCGEYRDRVIAVRTSEGITVTSNNRKKLIRAFQCRHDYIWFPIQANCANSVQWKTCIDERSIVYNQTLGEKEYDVVKLERIQIWFKRMIFINRLFRIAKSRSFCELWWNPENKGGWFSKKIALEELEKDLE